MNQLIILMTGVRPDEQRDHWVGERNVPIGHITFYRNGSEAFKVNRSVNALKQMVSLAHVYAYKSVKLEYHNGEFKLEYNIQYLSNERVAFTQFKKEGNVISSMNCVNQSIDFLNKLIEVDLNDAV